jgi:Glycosyltransferase family 87
MRFLAMFLVIVAVLLTVNDVIRYPLTSDLRYYLFGAEQIAHGANPYAPIPDSQLKYLYAPWFAVALIPATWLPFPIVALAWHSILAVSAGVSLWPVLRARRLEGTLAALLIGTFLFHGVWAGQIQPLMVALLVLALPTRWGPAAIGIAASLKVTPIVLCVLYAGRGEWGKVAVAATVAAVLWAPALLFDLSQYGIAVMQSHSLLGHSPVAWALVVIVALGMGWRLARTRYGWLAAATLWMAVLPRMILYDPSGLAVGATGPETPGREIAE